MRVAMFDLCGTIVLENTTRGFVCFIYKKYSLKWFLAQIACGKVFARVNGMMGKDYSRKVLAKLLGNMHREKLECYAKKYAEMALRKSGNFVVLSELGNERNKGACLILVTASVDPVAKAFGEALGFSYVFSSLLDYKEKVCAGSLKKDILGCKAEVVKPILRQHGFSEIVVYTDNYDDDDLIDISTQSYFVGDVSELAPRCASKTVQLDNVDYS